ncbi:MAG: hypothetical protein E7277_00015 [Lachnospiraceae bacterium]|nr:hypothetical protein [Lachnospiraceae bacterium]
MSERHAYLIMCHNHFEQLSIELSLLDYEFNDIYIHVDKRSRLSTKAKAQIASAVHLASITFVHSVKAAWGGDSLMNIELRLLKESTKTPHRYYHLLSGADLPLKTQAEIHSFFANTDKDYISLETSHPHNVNKNFLDRFRYYYPFQNMVGRNPSGFCYKLESFQKKLLSLQKKWGIDRTAQANFTYVKGAQWFSITHETACYVLKNSKRYQKYFRFTFIPDECFLQTIISDSPRLENVVDNNLRYIDWERGAPYTFQASDYEELLHTTALFARKFDCTIDNVIILKLQSQLLEK